MTGTPRDGLVAEYLFRGNAEDTSGHGRHGVVRGATLTADRFGNAASAYQFDGVDDEIAVAPPPILAADGMSVSVWARFDRRDLGGGGWNSCIVAQDDGDDDDQSRRVFQVSVRERHIVWHRMTCARDPQCKQHVRFDEWIHVVATYADKCHTLYVDGVLHDAVDADFWIHDEQPLHIGRKGTIETYFFFRGAIDDVRLYDRALSGDEVRALFTEGGFVKPPHVPDGARRDPISGRWGRHGVNFLDLTFDGERAVTGDVMDGRPGRRADIVSGSYDRATGALRLEGVGRHQKSGEAFPFLVEGTLDDDEVTVTATIGDFEGNFSLTKNGARWPWRYALARAINRTVGRVLGLRNFDED